MCNSPGSRVTHTNSTFEDLLAHCVVLALLDVGVKLPGQNHFVLLHLEVRQKFVQTQAFG